MSLHMNISELQMTDADFFIALKKERLLFHEGKEVDGKIVGDVALRSWQRCRAKGILPLYAPKIATEEELALARKENAVLLECAIPLIKKIFLSIKGSQSAVGISDAHGLVLYSINDQDAKFSKIHKSEMGIHSSEDSIGTNGYGTCIEERKTVEIIGAQHWALDASKWYCTASPIFDFKNSLIGVINIYTNINNLQLYTYGIVEALAEAISKQIQLNQMLLINETMLNSIDDGVAIINRYGKIIKYNNIAKKVLNLHDNTQYLITDIISNNKIIDNVVHKNYEYTDMEISLSYGDNNSILFLFSAKRLIPDKDMILIFKKLEHIRQYINRTLSANAVYTFDDIIGESVSLRDVRESASMIASSDMTTLILGETGTGKELFAQAIHNASRRRHGPFIAVNCGALPRDLVESEFFGYEGGAFTGALRQGRQGKFELADGGTIFLDEIGDMSFDAQTSLLRLLQEKTFTRVGGVTSRSVDVRVLAATHRNLEEMVRQNSFRQDLYYRLNVMTLRIPPLRERRDDIRLLAQHFLEKFAKQKGFRHAVFSDESLLLMQQYDWPGNIRELENCVEVAVNSSTGEVIHIKKRIAPPKNTSKYSYDTENNERVLSVLTESVILSVVKRNNYNILASSKELGIARATLYRKLKKWGVTPRLFRERTFS